MAIGNREVTDLPLLSVINGSDLYAVKADQDYRVKVGGPNGLAYLDTTGRLASEFLQPNLATFDPNSKVDVANYNWNTLPNKPTVFPTDWANVASKPSVFPTDWGTVTGKPTIFPTDWANVASKPTFHAVATSGNYDDLINKPTTMAPTAHTHAASDITSGVMAVARLGSGSPTTATFLRGDGTWAAIDWANITSKPATATRWPDWSEVTGKPSVAVLNTDVAFRDVTATRGDNSGIVYMGNAYLYNTGSTWQLSNHTTLSVGGYQVWTANNFNPADKATVGYSGDGDLNAQKTSGFYRVNLPSNAPSGSANYGQLIVSRGSASDTTMQILAGPTSNELWWRSGPDSGWYPWRQIWHSGNFDPATKVNNGGGVASIVKLTQAAYDALGTKDANTLYVVVG